MALILSIETATQVCSVAVHREGQLLGLFELHLNNMHSQSLVKLIDELLLSLSLTIRGLDAIAVSSGPGSYTGLRIGVSVAKGLAFAHDLPLIGVDTLHALGLQLKSIAQKKDYIIPMIDAKRMEVYASVLNGVGEMIEGAKPVILDNNSFEQYLEKGKVYFLGDGALKFKSLMSKYEAIFLPLQNSSISVGVLAFEKFKNSQFEDLAYFEPNYLKEFRVLKSTKNPFLI